MRKPYRTTLHGILVINLLICSCHSDDVTPCDSGIMLDYGSCLVFYENSKLNNDKEAIEAVVRETVSLVNTIMPVENLTVRVQVSKANAIPEIGIGGFNPSSQEVIISIDPDFPNLSQSISHELEPMLAHEMHHAKRRRAVGYGSTLLEACVSEGLADCFAMEVTGIAPPLWSVAVTGVELQNWINIARSSWLSGGYNHDKWFYGSNPDTPRWVGYSIGYKLVKDYIAAHPSRKASDLFDQPAGSFAQ